MQDWLKISLILCTYGFFREMRPSEPFVTEFLAGEWRNITEEQVNRDIYPLGTYSYLAQLVIIFLITDILRYKPIIVLSSCVGIVLWALLLWTYDLFGLQMTQLCYGAFMSAEVAYYTYIYAKVESEKYQQVTGHTRAALLIGKFLASVLAQILISYQWMNVRELNYISFSSQIISLLFALMLPSVKISLYFYSAKNVDDTCVADVDDVKPSNGNEVNSSTILDKAKQDENVRFSWRKAIQLIWQHAYTAYTNKTVVQWSIWWSLAMCGYLLVASYIQLLWKQIYTDSISANNVILSRSHRDNSNQTEHSQAEEFTNTYNGAVEAAVTLLGAAGAFCAGIFNSERYQKWDLWILTVCSFMQGGFLISAAQTNSIWVAYVMYVLFGVVYFFMITIASATVAKNLIEDSFGLIFGINTMLALAIQAIFTVVVISDSGFSLDCRGQFLSFGGFFIVLAVLYMITGGIDEMRSLKHRRQYQLNSSNL